MELKRKYRVRVGSYLLWSCDKEALCEPDAENSDSELTGKVFKSAEDALKALKTELKELEEMTWACSGKKKFKIDLDEQRVSVFKPALDWEQEDHEESRNGLSYKNDDGEFMVFDGYETQYSVESFYPVIREHGHQEVSLESISE